MIHDQISYTVSPEYFTHFKFIQFNVSEHLHNRAGAALVGLLATWWMGLVIGIVFIPVGLIIPTWKAYFYGMIKVFLIVCFTALIIGIAGLLFGLLTIKPDNLPGFYIPKGVTNPVRFSQVGYMHNGSYIGGGVSVVIGIIGVVIYRKHAISKLKNH